MTDRERRVTSLFFISLGALGLLAFAISIVNVSPPPPTASPLRSGLANLLVSLFGVPAGHLVFHTVFALGSAFMVWLSIKVRSANSGK
ncbi:MAG: hypothetical protein NTY00_01515 [Deltaproteobacteria bacterium]|nr:hypothetical protein [Deltaproteobacteria bacterium]